MYPKLSVKLNWNSTEQNQGLLVCLSSHQQRSAYTAFTKICRDFFGAKPVRGRKQKIG
jgi:hypothetical protein